VSERAAHEYRRKGGVSKISVMRWAPIYVWNLLRGIMVPNIHTRPDATPEAGPIRGSKSQKEVTRG
jgi:hypothetical protein